MGELRKRRDIWWIRYYRGGRRYEESARTGKWEVARDLLRSKEGEISKGIPVSPKAGRYKCEDGQKWIESDYTINRRRSLEQLKRRIRLHLTPTFGGRRLAEIATPDVLAFTQARLKAGAAAGEINRELSVLRRIFSLGVKHHGLIFKPYIPMLAEDNARSGFFDREQFEAVRAKLPVALRPIVTFAFATGWRIQSEVLPLEWRQVDREVGEVRLDAGTTKNKAGRVFPFTDELARLFADLWAQHEALEKKGKLAPYVFHRNAKRIKSLRGGGTSPAKLWACVDAFRTICAVRR